MKDNLKQEVEAESKAIFKKNDSKKRFRSSFSSKHVKYLAVVLILIAVPLTVILAQTRQDLRQYASTVGEASAIVVSPGSVNSKEGGISDHLSALAWDSEGNPLFSGISYEWSMSSDNSVGTLTMTQGNITEFIPLKAGYGQLVVIARQGNLSITKAIDVVVADKYGNIPTPTPAPTSTPTPTPLPTDTPTPTFSPTPTLTPTPTPSLTPVPTPIPTFTLSLSPSADTFVKSNAPGTNFGSLLTLETHASPTDISYLKFNLSSLAGRKIVKATLILKVSDASSQTQTLKRGKDLVWGEKTLTYNNKPGFDATIRTFNAKSVNGSVSLNVTREAILKIGQNLNLGIISAGDDKAAFYSREAAAGNRPQLVVEYQ